MRKTGKYIYGIINPYAENRFNPIPFFAETLFQATEDSASENSLPQIAETISDGENKISTRLDIIPYKNISAVVSECETLDYINMPKSTQAGLFIKHQKVIEMLMNSNYVIVPVKFGTLAADEAEVKDILHKGYSLIKETLKKISNKIEINVAVTWSNFGSILKQTGEDKEIKKLKARLLAKPEGMTAKDQAKIEQMLKKELGNKKIAYALQIQKALLSVSDDFKEHELMDDKMVANMAFFIDKSKQNNFDGKLKELHSRLADTLHFQCLGPLPPYSFYTLEIKKMQFGEIDWARKQFALSEVTNKKEIKRAYQQASLILHPDKNPGKPHTGKKFKEIVRAYNILLNYCRALEQTEMGDDYSFHEKKLKDNIILVKVSGQ